jgi:hypothetical protein
LWPILLKKSVSNFEINPPGHSKAVDCEPLMVSGWVRASRHQPKGRAPEREAWSPIALSARLGIRSGAAMLDMDRKRRGGRPMKYRLSQVQSTGDNLGFFAGSGFNIVNEHGAPIVTFGYLDPRVAADARALIETAIENAALITAA